MAQQWKYNGIELNENLSLNLYEMDLRQYDPAIARWIAIDPVTHHSQSTYTAFDNNPVFWPDPSGAATGFGAAGGFVSGRISDEDTWTEVDVNELVEGNDTATGGTVSYGSNEHAAMIAPPNDIHIDKKTKTATVVKTNDDYDRVFENGVQVASAELGYTVERLSNEGYTISTHVPEMVSQTEKNNFAKLNDSGFVGSLTYDFANSFYLAFQVVDGDYFGEDFINPLTGSRAYTNLDGTAQYNIDERTLSFVTTAAPQLNQTKLLPAFRTLNASQFSSMFKGTYISRAQAGYRGIMNRAYNSGVRGYNTISSALNFGTFGTILYKISNNN